MQCATSPGEDVQVDTHGATTNVTGALDVNVLGLRVAGLNLTAPSSVAGVTGDRETFSYPSQYLPTTPTPRAVGGTTLNVQGTSVTGSVDSLGLSITATALTSALTGSGGLLTALDTAVVSPVFRALGLDVGGADVWATTPPKCPLCQADVRPACCSPSH